MAWLVLLVIGYRGVTAIVLSETGATRSPAGAVGASGPRFPVALAGAYALQFAQVYLNASPQTAAQRAAGLSAFLPAAADPQLGWDGTGVLRLQSDQIAGVKVVDAHHAVVTLLARVNGHLMELGVPVYAADGAMVVSGTPAWLPAPRRAALPPVAAVAADPAVRSALMSQLPGFFRAYASGSEVPGRFLVPGIRLRGLSGGVAFGSLTGLIVPAGGPIRHVVATVLWHVAGQATVLPGPVFPDGQTVGPAGLQMSYVLTMVRRNGAWYVKSLAPSTQTAGQP